MMPFPRKISPNNLKTNNVKIWCRTESILPDEPNRCNRELPSTFASCTSDKGCNSPTSRGTDAKLSKAFYINTHIYLDRNSVIYKHLVQHIVYPLGRHRTCALHELAVDASEDLTDFFPGTALT